MRLIIFLTIFNLLLHYNMINIFQFNDYNDDQELIKIDIHLCFIQFHFFNYPLWMMMILHLFRCQDNCLIKNVIYA